MTRPPVREAVISEELEHPQPIPVAVWVRDALHTSPVGPRGADGSIPARLDEQIATTFANLERLLAAAGATREAVAFVNVQVSDRNHREAFNEQWTRFFPDEPRPARQVTETALPSGVHVLLTAVAYR